MKIIYFNVNGVLNVIKMSRILSKVRKEKAQIALLKDTHEPSRSLVIEKKGFLICILFFCQI